MPGEGLKAVGAYRSPPTWTPPANGWLRRLGRLLRSRLLHMRPLAHRLTLVLLCAEWSVGALFFSFPFQEVVMGFRRHVKKGRSARAHNKRAGKSHRLNLLNPMRGGIRI